MSIDDKKCVDNNEFYNFELGIPKFDLAIIEMVEPIGKDFSENANNFKLLFEDTEKPFTKKVICTQTCMYRFKF